MKAARSLTHLVFAVTVLLLQFAVSGEYLHGLLHGRSDRVTSCTHHEGSCNSQSNDPSDDDSCNSSCAVVLLSGGLTLDKSFEALPVERHFQSIHVEWTNDKPVQKLKLANDVRAPPVL